jgi:hypothetical protein
MKKVKRNQLGVQLLSRELHAQVFRGISLPPPPTTYVQIAKDHMASTQPRHPFFRTRLCSPPIARKGPRSTFSHYWHCNSGTLVITCNRFYDLDITSKARMLGYTIRVDRVPLNISQTGQATVSTLNGLNTMESRKLCWGLPPFLCAARLRHTQPLREPIAPCIARGRPTWRRTRRRRAPHVRWRPR